MGLASYKCSLVTIALKCTVFELRACDRQTDERTDGSQCCSACAEAQNSTPTYASAGFIASTSASQFCIPAAERDRDAADAADKFIAARRVKDGGVIRQS